MDKANKCSEQEALARGGIEPSLDGRQRIGSLGTSLL